MAENTSGGDSNSKMVSFRGDSEIIRRIDDIIDSKKLPYRSRADFIDAAIRKLLKECGSSQQSETNNEKGNPDDIFMNVVKTIERVKDLQKMTVERKHMLGILMRDVASELLNPETCKNTNNNL